MSAVALRRPAAVGAPETLLLGGLTMVTALCTVWAVTAAGWNDGMSLALLTTAVAVVEATLVASSSAGRTAALLLAPVLGLLVIVPLTLGSMPALAAGETGGLVHLVTTYGHAVTQGLVSDQSWSFQVGFVSGTWVCGFFAAWMAVRERNGLFAVLPLYGVLASNAINAPQLGPVALPSVLAMGASLLLVTRTTLATLERRWRGDRVIALPGTRRRFARVATLAALGITALAALLPPLSSTDLSGRIFHFTTNSLGRSGGRADAGGDAGAGLGATVHFSPNTEPGGPLASQPRNVLTYSLDGPAGAYLGVVDDVIFYRGNWYPAQRSRLQALASESGTLPRDRTPADGGVTRVAITAHARIVYTNDVTSLGDVTQVPFPGEPEAVDRTVTVFGLAPARGGSLVTVDHVDLPLGIGASATVAVDATIPTATEAQLRTAGVAYPAWITEGGFTTTPVSSGAETTQLADIQRLARSWTTGLTDAYDQARAIETRLRTAPFAYTLTPPDGVLGEWRIHQFLFSSHAGYCQYFASSMGTLLRTLGIPSRLVSGYGPGSADDGQQSSRTVLRRVTTSDAHVWVQAYFPQYGWITFEPTPPSSDGDYQPIPRPATNNPSPTPVAAPAVPVPSATAAAPSPSPTASPTAGAGSTVTGAPPALLATVGGLAALALLIVCVSLWLRRPRTLRGLWVRMRIAGRLLGERREPSETLAAFCTRLGERLPPDSVSVLDHRGRGLATGRAARERAVDALAVIGAASGKAAFSRDGLDATEVNRWRHSWTALVDVLPVLLWRRLLRGEVSAEEPGGARAAGSPQT